MGELAFLIERGSRYLEEGLRHHNLGEHGEAREAYLRAAEMLYRAARESPELLREKRLEQAQRLTRMAEDLEKLPDRPRSGPAARTAPAADEGPTEGRFRVMERPQVRFDDVAGLDDLKEEIRVKFLYPFTHPEKARTYGVRAGGGILLYGPPGTGKTLMARAIAGEIEAAFFTVKPSEIMSKWVGEAERNVEKLFLDAHAEPRSVIFIDEIEALVPRRSDSGSTVMQRVVPQFLAELEGFEKHAGALLFVGATNEPWALDPAVLRPGRFDARVYVPLPDLPARRRILELNLRGKPVEPGLDLEAEAARLEGLSGADIVNLCARATVLPFLEAVRSGVDRPIGKQDFDAALRGVRPSVPRKLLEKFARFQAES